MNDARSYTVSVQFGLYAGEECYEARVVEFPDVREYADSYAEAYDLAIDAIEILAEHLAERGVPVPPPQVEEREFSGRVTLRLPKTLHRQLAECSGREGVSFNQHVVNMLCYAQGKADSVAEVKRQQTEIAAIWEKKVVRDFKLNKTQQRTAVFFDEISQEIALPRLRLVYSGQKLNG
jgi:predicted HicB family RNase H-like nuclease